MTKKYPLTLPDFHLNKTHVALLKLARSRIKAGERNTVCFALKDGIAMHVSVGIETKKEARLAVDDLHRFVRRAIKGCMYFTDWQYSKGLARTEQEVRKDRVKWLKYIIDHGAKA